MQGLDLRRARLGQRGLRIEHVQLRAGAGLAAGVGEPQSFLGLLLQDGIHVQRHTAQMDPALNAQLEAA